MKKIAIPLLIAVIFGTMMLYLISFQVRETEAAFITRFGRPLDDREITRPGLYFKWPTPIERVHRFDARMRVLDTPPAETTTRGAVPLIVSTYVVWRVAEPLKFLNALGSVADANDAIRYRLNNAQNRVIGEHTFDEFVNSDTEKIKLAEIQAEMLADLQEPVRNDYGIEIKTLGIKQLKISEDVTKEVFERMRAERRRRTEATIAQGHAEATKIRTDADAKTTALLAAAEGRAKAIRGRGDAEAAQYYQMMEEAPELAMFLRNLEALQTTLKERATLVIPPDAEPFKYLREMPSLEPGK
ncbi:MAG: SPFH domain-containing protein [Planctomycetota bacterium]|nr:SPFH domain-containing protein [Planctomycetota bacterium]